MEKYIPAPFVAYPNIRRWTITLSLLAFISVGFFTTLTLSVENKQLQVAAIGDLGRNDLKEGVWFRYDFTGIQNMAKFRGWNLEGGSFYLITKIVDTTIWDDLGDEMMWDGGSGNAFEWTITPYWTSNDAIARELINGTYDNDAWNVLASLLYDGYLDRENVGQKSPDKFVRPYIDQSLISWRNYASVNNEGWAEISGKTWLVPDYGASFGVAKDAKIVYTGDLWYLNNVQKTRGAAWLDYPFKYSDTPYTGTDNRTRENTWDAVYDKDTGILLGVRMIDINFCDFRITGYSDGLKSFGLTPEEPASLFLEFKKTVGVSYEYDLMLSGIYDRAVINITSSNVNYFPNALNMIVTTKTIPIDIKANVTLNVSAYGILYGVKSNVTRLIQNLTYISPTGQVGSVTLMNATKQGNSIFLEWTSNPDAYQYRIFLNGTFFGSPITTNQTTITPSSGIYNITIVCDSAIYDESSNHSNGIVINFTLSENDFSETNYAFTTTPPVEPTTNVILIVMIVGIILGVLIVISVMIYKKYGSLKTIVKNIGRKM